MKKKKLIIDTNLLLLLVIGALEGGRHIRNSKRLGAYNYDDYKLVCAIMGDYDLNFVTPYIATEISNLIDLNGKASDSAFEMARELFSQFEQIDSNIIQDCEIKLFPTFGITDSSLIRLVSDYTVLTDDNRLVPLLLSVSENNVISFEWMRKALYKS